MKHPAHRYSDTSPHIDGTNFSPEAFMVPFGDLPQERQDVLAAMVPDRTWIQNTDPDVLRRLLSLGYQQNPSDTVDAPTKWNKLAEWDKFVAIALDHPDVIGTPTTGETQVLALADVKNAGFAGIVQFDVLSPTGLKYKYEFIMWRQGRFSGSKGLVVVSNEAGDPVGLLMRRGPRFATGNRAVFDIPGGFAEPEDTERLGGLAAGFIREAEEELGLTDIDEVISLGTVPTDPGMTNNEPGVFLATARAEAARLAAQSRENSDLHEIGGNTVFVPLDRLPSIINSNESDGILHAAVLRAMSHEGVPEKIRRALLGTVAGNLALGQSVMIGTESAEAPPKRRAQSGWAKAARVILAATYPLQFPFLIVGDLNYEARMVRQERSAQGRPYQRGTGLLRSIPRAATWMVGQGLRDSLELASAIRNFTPSKPMRPRVPSRRTAAQELRTNNGSANRRHA